MGDQWSATRVWISIPKADEENNTVVLTAYLRLSYAKIDEYYFLLG